MGEKIMPVLRGLRVLVVEDESLLALSLTDDLHSFGCSVLGPFGDLSEARDGARDNDFDLAILDVNLNGEMVFPLADDLSQRGIPFLFLTGYAVAALPDALKTAPHMPKPYDAVHLAKKMQTMVGA
jgi:DNA-binding response OmpR family regulator